MQFSAIIFDMDGLMLDTERLARRAWRQAGAEWGYAIPDEVYLLAVGRTKPDTEKLFRDALGPDFPFQEMYEHKQAYMQAATEDGIPIKPGLFDLLARIDALGLAKTVATSTARPMAIQKLTLSGLIERFDFIVCGDEVANGKPAPDIYLAAALGLKASPTECLVLEDSEAGIRAAYAAGMTPVMIPDLKQPSPETRALAYRVLPSLAEVVGLLNSAL